jgi:C1A family cysteine protease
MKLLYKQTLFILCISLCCMEFTVAYGQTQKRFFTGDNTAKSDIDKLSRPAERATRDMENLPAVVSLKPYAPLPGNQGMHGTCVAWSTSYAARTISYCIQRKITDPEKIKAAAFSPGYLYYQVKNAGDTNCSGGANIEMALRTLTNKGDLLKSDNIPDCVNSIDNQTDSKAKSFTIKAFTRLSETYSSISKNEISTIKKSLSEKKPVLISLKCMNSFFSVSSTGEWVPKANDVNQGNHAMCIIGYDDNKLGGAFEVMNSWGTSWGNRGFVWITYAQMQQYGNYAVEMMDRETADQSEIKGNMDFVLLDGTSMPVLRSKINTRSITVEDDDKADYSSYRLAENYPGGTAFKIRFTTNAPAFVYIFSVDDKNVVSKLFPYANDISPAINSADATVYLPSENKHARLSREPGTENICVLYSKSPIDFDRLMNSINQAPSKMYETIMAAYKEQLIPMKFVDFDNAKINFTAKAAEQQMVCFFINMNHK